jgi:transposase
MPRRRISMRKLLEILRLKASGLSDRQVASSVSIARSTVAEYLRRLEEAGLSWPFAEEIGEEELERRLFDGPPGRGRDESRSIPDWPEVQKELKRKGVTLKLLWEEHRADHPETYSYSQFCEHYRRWAKNIDVRMRQTHKAGERLFVDYAGQTMPITNPRTGEIRQAQIFVGTMGASDYLFCEATETQKLHDWIDSHTHNFEYMGGVPEIIVPDNPKVGVTKACRYEPDLNPTYQDMAAHYGTAVLPARPRKPRDKAKVESGVQIVEREILAPLRHRTFFSLAELNAAIRERLEKVNSRKLQKMGVSRRELFEQIDRPALKPLPTERYEYAEFLKCRVNIDYHVEVKGHYYSVPYDLAGRQLDVRLTARTVEVLERGRRVASHMRDDTKGRHTTSRKHMPKAHQKHLEWTPSRILQWAGRIGPGCATVAQHIMETRPHPEQGYRACLGIIRLAKGYGEDRVEAACQRAASTGVCSYRSVKSILKTGRDREPIEREEDLVGAGCRLDHENVRGRSYYGVTPEVES